MTSRATWTLGSALTTMAAAAVAIVATGGQTAAGPATAGQSAAAADGSGQEPRAGGEDGAQRTAALAAWSGTRASASPSAAGTPTAASGGEAEGASREQRVSRSAPRPAAAPKKVTPQKAAPKKAAPKKATPRKAAPKKATPKKVALGPRATLSRTPAARSAKTTRVASAAFPDLGQFTWVGPVSGTRQTSGFGQRWGRLHAGLDFAGAVGTRLKSLSSGVVTFAGVQGGYGNKVEIMMWDGSLVYYGHMDSIAVKTGQKVRPGQVVGRLGDTGHSTGPHLHLEVHPQGQKPLDPWPWLVERGILPRDVPRKG